MTRDLEPAVAPVATALMRTWATDLGVGDLLERALAAAPDVS